MNKVLEAERDVMTEETRSAAVLCAAVAAEIRVARGLLEELAGVLCSDERFVLQYLEQFQAFDLVLQHVDESAALLERFAQGHGLDEAIDGVRLTAVQDRLRSALGWSRNDANG